MTKEGDEQESKSSPVVDSLWLRSPLDGTVSVETSGEDPNGFHTLTIVIGNTGLTLRRVALDESDDYQPGSSLYWIMDFTPEGKRTSVKGKEVRYSFMFVYAIYELLEWLDSQEPDYLRKIQFPHEIRGETNKEMFRFREKLFAVERGEEEIFSLESIRGASGPEGPKYNYRFNLQNLLGNERIRAKLRGMHDKCERMHYKVRTLRGYL